jgi:hypothetical protein
MRETYIHGVAAGRDLAGVALRERPEKGVGKGVFPKVGEYLLLNLEARVVG